MECNILLNQGLSGGCYGGYFSNVGSPEAFRNLNPAGVVSSTLQQDEEEQTDNIIRNNLTDQLVRMRVPMCRRRDDGYAVEQAAPGSQSTEASQTNVVTNRDAAVRLDLSGAARQQTEQAQAAVLERFPGQLDLAAGDDLVDGAATNGPGAIEGASAIRGFADDENTGDAGAFNLGAAQNDDLLPGQSAAPRGTNLDIVA